MNLIELNAILYYADFLSLLKTSHPITDTCKYFFIHGAPINSAYIAGVLPNYNQTNPYFTQALTEYLIIRDKFGEEGVESFINDICSIKASGTVNAEQMLKQIHLFSNKRERKQAFATYYNWKNNQKYTHIITDGDGNQIEQQCTKYILHFERNSAKPSLAKSI